MSGGPVTTRLESPAFAGMVLGVGRARWREAISTPYRASVDVVIPSPDEDPLLLLGEDAVLSVARDGAERRLVGIVTEVEALEPEIAHNTHVRVRIEPAFALLGLGQRSRIFQDKTVPEILEAVLGEALGAYGREVELSLEGDYPTREYCVQYRESDLAFVERLAEEEGISYAFDHEGDVERLVLRDRNAFSPAATADSPVRFVPRAGAQDAEIVYELRRASRPTTTKVTARDHDWTAPATPKSGETGEDGRESYEHGLGRSLTISDYGGESYGAHDADRQVALRLEALRRDATVVEGESRVIGLAAGSVFTLGGHSSALDLEYLVVEAEHRYGEDVPENRDDPYANRFVCIPNDVPYRPLRARGKPRVAGVQTALVTGPAGEEIHTDSHGRVKVQFHWDLAAPGDETSSCWLRVRQTWAGSQWGFVFLPRIGMEVVVHFEGGDPDRPVVQGCLYDSEHRPPYALPDHKTRSTIKSESSPGGGGFNELRFEDKAGSEQIYLHAQKDLDEVVLNDHTTQVGGDQTNSVHQNQTQTVDGKQDETVDGDQTMTVDGNRSVTVTGAFKETILAGEERKVTGAEQETILGGETRLILGPFDEDLRSTETRNVIGGQTEMIVGGHTQSITGAHTEAIVGALNQLAAGNYTVTSTGGTFLGQTGAALTMVGGSSGTLTGTTITINCTERIEMDPITVKAKPFDNSSIGTKITQASVGVDICGLTMEAGGAKAEAWALAIELFSSKLSIIGAKIDISIIKPKFAGTSFNAAFKIVL